jgi:very-short-patch-repair endonuclease
MTRAKPPTLARISPAGRPGRCEPTSDSDAGLHRTVRLLDGMRMSVAIGAPVEARIGMIAGSQRGRVARDQLRECGIGPGAIDRRLRSGRLERVHQAVYALPHTSELPLAAEAAALLACGQDAVLSHHSAATLWRLRPGSAQPVHVTIPGRRGLPAPHGVKLHRSRTLSDADLRLHEGLPVTAPARTLLDVAAGLCDRDVERQLDEALFVRRILTLAEVDDVLARAGSHPGRARLARVAANHTRSTRTDSPPEERLFRLIRSAGLPEPRLGVVVLDYRLDFLWPELGLAVEVDAYGTHGSRSRFEADRRRDAKLLTECGIVVIRLTRTMVEQCPFEAVGVVARALGQREAELRSAKRAARAPV